MVFFIVGSPLSGKTTLAKKLNFNHPNMGYFSTGEYARLHGMGKEKSIEEFDLSLSLDEQIRQKVKSIMLETKTDCIIDGFPRSRDQISDIIGLGIPFKVVFMYVNPLLMHERAFIRHRDNNDEIEIVINRAKASQKLWNDIKSMIKEDYLFFFENEVDSFSLLEDFICGK